MSFRTVHLETDLWIAVTARQYRAEVERFAFDRTVQYRKILDKHIKDHPGFLTSLEPVQVTDALFPIVGYMYDASEKAGTGPMSAVAGAFAQHILGDLISKYGFEEIIVENGGDIYMNLTHPATISVYAGDSPLSEKIGLVIKPEQTPLSVCCSSATVGHSLSFGTADAAVIACRDGALADAYATACCNAVKNVDMIQDVTESFLQKPKVLSVVIIKDDKIAIGGEIEVAIL